MKALRRNALVLLTSLLLGGGIFAAATRLLFRQVLWGLCEDVAYRDRLLADLGSVTIAAGAVVGLLVGCIIIGVRLESPVRIAIGASAAAGLVGAAVVFSFCCAMAATVPISPVSLTWAYRPWWRPSNWLFALFGFLFVGAVAFTAVRACYRPAPRHEAVTKCSITPFDGAGEDPGGRT